MTRVIGMRIIIYFRKKTMVLLYNQLPEEYAMFDLNAIDTKISLFSAHMALWGTGEMEGYTTGASCGTG